MLLTTLAQHCAPQVAPSTLAAIVQVESGGNPLAMWNNNTRSMVLLGNPQQAIAYLRQAMAAGQRVDVGLAQVDTENFASYGLNPSNAFNACTNLRAGAKILNADYRKATAAYGPGEAALYHAFEAYNSGHLRGDAVYANRVLAAAGIPVQMGSGGGLSYAWRPNAPLAFVETWGGAKPANAMSKPKKTALAYSLNW
ncbi:lytic transglycosylase domain-containing protein [Acidithiobacillus sp. IBUN Pt1247-S3]|uniref:lytic transglycosylase domain-containing protein n=1 Tax=Acidithiobacillus sp. IBUN Pt1247-S3 TaxID=3166642 RepID=UPI0034E45BFF